MMITFLKSYLILSRSLAEESIPKVAWTTLEVGQYLDDESGKVECQHHLLREESISPIGPYQICDNDNEEQTSPTQTPTY